MMGNAGSPDRVERLDHVERPVCVTADYKSGENLDKY